MYSAVRPKSPSEEKKVVHPTLSGADLSLRLNEGSIGSGNQRIDKIIESFFISHCERLWAERKEEKGFPVSSLGTGLTDDETLESSGARSVLKAIQNLSSPLGRKSLWVSSTLNLSRELKDQRHAACKEIATNPELQKFIHNVATKVEKLDRILELTIQRGPDRVALGIIKAIRKEVLEVKKALASEPKFDSLLIKKILSDIHDSLNSPGLSSVQFIERDKTLHFIQTDKDKLYIPNFSRNTFSTLKGVSGVAAGLAVIGGLCGLADRQIELARLFAVVGWPMAQIPYSNYIGQPHAEKCGAKLIDLFDDESRMKIGSAGGLLNELYTLSELRSRFPDITSFSEKTTDPTIGIERMRHPGLCLQGANPVASDIFITSSKPLLIGGQNTGGKTIGSEGLIQNFIIDSLGGPMFGTKVQIAEAEDAILQVPQQSKGTLGGGRFETEARQTIKYASIANRIVILSLDEVGGGTSREEARPIQCLAIGELAAKGYFVVVVSHDYELINYVASRNLASSLMVELDETGAPTFQLIPGIPQTSGFEPVLNMTGLAEDQALARIRNAGGSEDAYWRFRNEQ